MYFHRKIADSLLVACQTSGMTEMLNHYSMQEFARGDKQAKKAIERLQVAAARLESEMVKWRARVKKNRPKNKHPWYMKDEHGR
jgi:hypothetical protein